MKTWPALFTVSFSLLNAADARWIRMNSTDFEIYSTASEKTTRETLKHFEQVRTFFAQASGRDASKSSTIRVVLFNSKKEYEPYRPNEFAAAHYQAGAERDYIVLGGSSPEAFPIAVHEYVHLVAKRSSLKLPIWLNEGLADLYSTLQEYGGKIAVGGVIPGHYQALFNERWVPLSTLFVVDAKSPFYNEKNKAGSLYSESWALTHMLVLGADYRPGFEKALAAIDGGMPSEEALLKIYGKSLPVIEKDLQLHIRNAMNRAMLFPVKLDKKSEDVPAEPASLFDVRLTLVDLIDRPGKEDEVEKRLTELAGEDSKRPEPHVELGYLAWRREHPENARKEFQKAAALGARSPRLLWDYARLEATEDPEAAITALHRLLEQEERVDARILIASLQLETKHPEDAIASLQPVSKVSKEDAPKLFRVWAYAQLQTGKVQEARSTVKRWMDTAQTPADKDDAARLQQYLETPRPSGPAPQQAFTSLDPREVPPPLQRRDTVEPSEQGSSPRPFPGWQSATGSFVRLDCKGDLATVVVQTSGGLRQFLIDDPGKILIDGKSGQTLDLTCGPQRSIAVRIDFEPTEVEKTGVNGVVRGIHFGP